MKTNVERFLQMRLKHHNSVVFLKEIYRRYRNRKKDVEADLREIEQNGSFERITYRDEVAYKNRNKIDLI